MSYHQETNINSIETTNTAHNAEKKIIRKVDINDLLFKIREKEKLQRKENLLLFSLIVSVILITGIIASL